MSTQPNKKIRISEDQGHPMADRVKAIRRASGKTQQQLADVCQVRQQSWSAWELGKKNPGDLSLTWLDFLEFQYC